MEAATINQRQQRGLALASDKRIKRAVGDKWLVPSQSGPGAYLVDTKEHTCSCPDFETRRAHCKHQWAVAYARHEVREADGTTTVTETLKVTYTQDWPAYNRAQANERDHVETLLRDLCSGLVTAPHPGRGPKPIPLADVVFGMTTKVYSGFSARRASSDIRACAAEGKMTRAPHYNSIIAAFDKPELAPVLTKMIEDSAAPLASIEQKFAVDSTGFSTSVYRRWYDAKYGKEMKESTWLKAHAMAGTVTNVVTAISITDGNANDSPELPVLVRATDRHFQVAEVSADKAYLGHANLEAIEAVGAVPYIPFKSNSQGNGSAAWRRMWGMFMYRSAEFLAHYHQRSNVETTFSMIKRKFGGSLRSRNHVAQVNELLCKVLCHNLAVLVHAMYELNITPKLDAR
jgi:transposase